MVCDGAEPLHELQEVLGKKKTKLLFQIDSYMDCRYRENVHFIEHTRPIYHFEAMQACTGKHSTHYTSGS